MYAFIIFPFASSVGAFFRACYQYEVRLTERDRYARKSCKITWKTVELYVNSQLGTIHVDVEMKNLMLQ